MDGRRSKVDAKEGNRSTGVVFPLTPNPSPAFGARGAERRGTANTERQPPEGATTVVAALLSPFGKGDYKERRK